MHRSLQLAAAAAVAAALAAVPAAAQAAAGPTLTFKESDKGAQFSYLDVPPRNTHHRHRVSAGDGFFFTENLVSDAGRHLGHLRAECRFTANQRGRSAPVICTGAFAFRYGTMFVMVSSSNIDAKVTRGVVVGGTGVWANARGTFTSVSTRHGSDDTVSLVG